MAGCQNLMERDVMILAECRSPFRESSSCQILLSRSASLEMVLGPYQAIVKEHIKDLRIGWRIGIARPTLYRLPALPNMQW